MVPIGIAVLGTHIKVRGQSSVIFGRYRRLEKVDISDGLGVERREQPGKVINLIERNIVEHTEILVGISSVDIHSRQTFLTL